MEMAGYKMLFENKSMLKRKSYLSIFLRIDTQKLVL
ncbi:hypothetical protein NEOC95_001495 [Neochlamydia sp. AcF95]|nr:hypothetical protein [Neochlamydia sp. AcF95]